jgi:hypothetical protein
MVQILPSPSLNGLDYRRVVEAVFCETIVELIRSGQTQWRGKKLTLLDFELTVLDHPALRQGSTKDETAKTRVRQEVQQHLLDYLQKLVELYSQRRWFSAQPQLAQERQQLGLSEQTAKQLNAVIRLEVFDQQLWEIVQENGWKLPRAAEQISRLQAAFEITDQEMPPLTELRSEQNINYIRLWRLLQAQDWQMANRETHHCLVHLGPQRDPRLSDVEQISLADLRLIDALWQRYSHGRFSFSTQLEIWHSAEVAEDVTRFAKAVGWQRLSSWISYDLLDFSLDAPKGHLPALPHLGWWCWVGGMRALLAKVEAAKTL